MLGDIPIRRKHHIFTKETFAKLHLIKLKGKMPFMAVKKFTWVSYSPPLDYNPTLFERPASPDHEDAVLDFATPAPANQSNRPTLHSRFYPVADSPNDEFLAYNVVHDMYRRYTAYDPADPSSSSEIEITSVYPSRFAVYELKGLPGAFYATTSINSMKEIFRRYRNSTRNESSVLKVRILDVQCLEVAIKDAEVVGYKLLDVSGVTPYLRLQAEGPQIAQNPEAQDLVRRAGHMQGISIRLQSKTLIVELEIRDDGSIRFSDSPGDSTALDAIYKLETLIAGCSDTRLVQVRQRGGR